MVAGSPASDVGTGRLHRRVGRAEGCHDARECADMGEEPGRRARDSCPAWLPLHWPWDRRSRAAPEALSERSERPLRGAPTASTDRRVDARDRAHHRTYPNI